MSTDFNNESVQERESISIIKKPPNNIKNINRKSQDLNNYENENIHKITSIRNKKKLENKIPYNKLDSSSITSNGNKDINDKNFNVVDGNFSFSKVKRNTSKSSKTKYDVSKNRTASAINMRKNYINGNNDKNQSMLDKKETNLNHYKNNDRKKNHIISKNKGNLANLNSSNTRDKTINSKEKNNKDLFNNNYIKKRINNRRSSCDDAIVNINNKDTSGLDSSRAYEKHKKFNDLYERLTNHKSKIYDKVEIMKKKLEEEELKQLKNTPNINKSSKYYEKESEDFLKRVEIYKFVSKAKRIDLIEKDQKKLEEELNKNPKLKKKMKLDQIQKIIDNKLESDKLKKKEKEIKIQQMKKNFEESKLAECTFAPEISENSKKMDVTLKRNKFRMNKSSSAPRFLETENSKKFNKSVNLDTSALDNETSIHSKKKIEFSINTSLNMNNSTNNIHSQTTKNSENKIQDKEKNDILRESHSMNTLIPLNSKGKNLNNNIILDSSNFNETISKDENKSFSGLSVNISKKESDIIKELLRKKFNI